MTDPLDPPVLSESSQARLAESRCPSCFFKGKLRVINRFQVQPIGSFSLAGAQMKFSSKVIPVLVCENCDFESIGSYDGEGHMEFTNL